LSHEGAKRTSPTSALPELEEGGCKDFVNHFWGRLNPSLLKMGGGAMIELDILSGEIEALMTEQREAWRELAVPTLTAFDRREIRNRIRQGEIELREHLTVRTDRLRFRPRPAETPTDSLANIEFRLL
jgi:hypothetical protein